MRYYKIKSDFRVKEDRERVVKGLLDLRKLIQKDVLSKDSEDNLLLATWNIRDFGKPLNKRRGFGPRLKETYYYIAEIISHFDIVAVQEVNELDEWDDVMYILGPDWDFIASDETDPGLGGNGERLTYVFDRRKVSFKNIAGEIVLPANMLINRIELAKVVEQVEESGAAAPPDSESTEQKEEKFYSGKQFRRSPYLVSFQSGWFRFDICTVHIYYGTDSGEKLKERIEEIGAVASYFGSRGQAAIDSGKALILLGDFNIMHPEHKTMKALTDNDFTVPGHTTHKTNIKQTKYYDQIAFKAKDGVVRYSSQVDGKKGAGVIDFFQAVFKSSMDAVYEAEAQKTAASKGKQFKTKKAYYEEWRTYQMSDHMPLWVRLQTNDSNTYLDSLVKAVTG